MNDTVLPTRQFTALVRAFQADDPKLEVDGILGPRTTDALDRYIGVVPTAQTSFEIMDPMAKAWKRAALDIGKGGDLGDNNSSDYIRGLRTHCGFPLHTEGPWCAVFVSYHLLKSGLPIKSRGAYTLCEKMANHNRGVEVLPEAMVPGQVYVACWKRGRWGTHQEAHVRLVRRRADGLYEGIGGNEHRDKVRLTSNILPEVFEKDLIMVVGWNV